MKHKGVVLIFSLAILSILLTISLFFTLLSISEYKVSQNDTELLQARMTANSGVEKAISELINYLKKPVHICEQNLFYNGEDKNCDGLLELDEDINRNGKLDWEESFPIYSEVEGDNLASLSLMEVEPIYIGQKKLYISGTLPVGVKGKKNFFLLKINDVSGKLWLNDPNPKMRQMLNNLSEFLKVGIRLGDVIIKKRPLDGYRFYWQVREVLKNDEIYKKVLPHIALNNVAEENLLNSCPLEKRNCPYNKIFVSKEIVTNVGSTLSQKSIIKKLNKKITRKMLLRRCEPCFDFSKQTNGYIVRTENLPSPFCLLSKDKKHCKHRLSKCIFHTQHHNMKENPLIIDPSQVRNLSDECLKNLYGKRAFININTASSAVLYSVLAGIKGIHIVEKLFPPPYSYKDVDACRAENLLYGIVQEVQITPEKAMTIVKHILWHREKEPFKNFKDFEKFLDKIYKDKIITQPEKSLLEAHFNPVYIPNYPPETRNTFSVIDKWLVTDNTTEFSFTSSGVFEISSLGVVATEKEISASREIFTVVQLSKKLPIHYPPIKLEFTTYLPEKSKLPSYAVTNKDCCSCSILKETDSTYDIFSDTLINKNRYLVWQDIPPCCCYENTDVAQLRGKYTTEEKVIKPDNQANFLRKSINIDRPYDFSYEPFYYILKNKPSIPANHLINISPTIKSVIPDYPDPDLLEYPFYHFKNMKDVNILSGKIADKTKIMEISHKIAELVLNRNNIYPKTISFWWKPNFDENTIKSYPVIITNNGKLIYYPANKTFEFLYTPLSALPTKREKLKRITTPVNLKRNYWYHIAIGIEPHNEINKELSTITNYFKKLTEEDLSPINILLYLFKLIQLTQIDFDVFLFVNGQKLEFKEVKRLLQDTKKYEISEYPKTPHIAYSDSTAYPPAYNPCYRVDAEISSVRVYPFYDEKIVLDEFQNSGYKLTGDKPRDVEVTLDEKFWEHGSGMATLYRVNWFQILPEKFKEKNIIEVHILKNGKIINKTDNPYDTILGTKNTLINKEDRITLRVVINTPDEQNLEQLIVSNIELHFIYPRIIYYWEKP